MISLHQGSILDAKTDYIVNPANSFLRHGGGLAKVIAEAATAPFSPTAPDGEPWSVAELHVLRAKHNESVNQWILDHEHAPLIATGNALVTSAGALPFKGIIHAVGPIWNGNNFYETELLRSAIESVCEQLPEGASVAIPAISSGVFGMPIDVVARVSVEAAGWYEGEHDIQFWLFSDEHMAAFARQIDSPVFG